MQEEARVARWVEAHGHLEEALPEISALMEQKFSQVGGVPEPGSDLDQCGLRDGAEIVRDYMAHNEWGVALEHLRYMIKETNLPISVKTYASIQAAAQLMEIDPWFLKEDAPLIGEK